MKDKTKPDDVSNIRLLRKDVQTVSDEFVARLDVLAAQIRSGEKNVEDFIILYSCPDSVEILERSSGATGFYMLEFARAHLMKRSGFVS